MQAFIKMTLLMTLLKGLPWALGLAIPFAYALGV
jgi:hypothetical protein